MTALFLGAATTAVVRVPPAGSRRIFVETCDVIVQFAGRRAATHLFWSICL